MREAYILLIVLMTIVIGLMIYKFFIKKSSSQPDTTPVFQPGNVAKPRKSTLIKWDCTGSKSSPDWPNKPRFIRPAGSVDMNNPLTTITPTSNDDNSIVFDQNGETVFTVSLKSLSYFYKTDDTGTNVSITFKQNPVADLPAALVLVPTVVPNELTYVDLTQVTGTNLIKIKENFFINDVQIKIFSSFRG